MSFDHLIGQHQVKRKLNFYLDAFKATHRLPFLLFNAPKGLGKTEFAKALCSQLTRHDGSPRDYLEINASIIKNNEAFFEQIFPQYLMGNRQITLFFDEAHNLAKDLQQALLTICNVESEHMREFSYNGDNYPFNFKNISFVFATTEADQLFAPLRDRLDPVDFKPYTDEELGQILKASVNSDGAEISAGAMAKATASIRQNPRSAVKLAQHIITYCNGQGTDMFDESDFEKLKSILGIMPYGLTDNELSVLRVLHERGPQTLSMISSVTGMSNSALRSDVEKYLIYRGLINIDVKRILTQKGKKFVDEMSLGAKI